MMICAASDGAAIEPGNISGGIAAVMFGIAFRVDRLVPNARRHDAHLARAPMRKLARLFEPMALNFPFRDELLEVRIGDLDALFLDGKLAEITSPGAAIVRAFAATFAILRGGVVVQRRRCLRDAERLGHRVEFAHLRGKLEFELPRVVDAARPSR